MLHMSTLVFTDSSCCLGFNGLLSGVMKQRDPLVCDLVIQCLEKATRNQPTQMLFGANGKAIQLHLFLATIKMAGLSEELTQANDFLQMGESEDLMVVFREDVTECDLFIRVWQ